MELPGGIANAGCDCVRVGLMCQVGVCSAVRWVSMETRGLRGVVSQRQGLQGLIHDGEANVQVSRAFGTLPRQGRRSRLGGVVSKAWTAFVET